MWNKQSYTLGYITFVIKQTFIIEDPKVTLGILFWILNDHSVQVWEKLKCLFISLRFQKIHVLCATLLRALYPLFWSIKRFITKKHTVNFFWFLLYEGDIYGIVSFATGHCSAQRKLKNYLLHSQMMMMKSSAGTQPLVYIKFLIQSNIKCFLKV